ncbi:hypothetical protein FTUN_0087 [Frigoriglobus tundricola]|uniref:Uncharacterized protein n=1 Tax=Frigoriglobus tundricola TaxID=2774151 RepID=A0A6M5YGZ5_9BACT|nr:hypothetical protein FTUN_0087 [Frigoriglobus tundricola]
MCVLAALAPTSGSGQQLVAIGAALLCPSSSPVSRDHSAASRWR